MDLAPYAGAIEKVSTLVDGVVRRVLPEKMGELDAAKMKQEITLALLTQQGTEVLKEFEDRADARALAQKDAEKGNAFTNMLSATVRPFFGYLCMTAFIVPLAVRYAAVFAGYVLTPAQVELLTPNQIEKEIILTVIYFYFGGRTVEKGIALWKGKGNGTGS